MIRHIQVTGKETSSSQNNSREDHLVTSQVWVLVAVNRESKLKLRIRR